MLNSGCRVLYLQAGKNATCLSHQPQQVYKQGTQIIKKTKIKNSLKLARQSASKSARHLPLLCVYVISLQLACAAFSEMILSETGMLASGKIPEKATTILFDMDGVLAEVSQSYRAAIVATCRDYGANSVTYDVISQWKARGNCNNDWQLSLDLIKNDPKGNKDVTYEEVVSTFERHYQGDAARQIKGLCELETLIPTKTLLEELKQRIDALNIDGEKVGGMAIVTGRPRKDCDNFLKSHNIEQLFDVAVCMEDGPPKPDPHILLEACKKMGISPSEKVLLVGDTPDDIRAAIAAGCTAVGVVTPENALKAARDARPFDSCLMSRAMRECGAHTILEPGFAELLDVFPPV